MIDQQQQRDTADERATLAELIAEGAAERADERAAAAPDDPPSCGTNCC